MSETLGFVLYWGTNWRDLDQPEAIIPLAIFGQTMWAPLFTLDWIMSAASQPLYELQQIDSQLESAGVKLSHVRRQLSGDPQLDKAEKELSRLDVQQKSAQSDLRALEAKADDLEVRAKHLNDNLYGGLVTDAREMRLLETEITHAKEAQKVLEDEEISIMERLESLDSQVSTTRSEIESLRAARQSTHGHLIEEEMLLQAEIGGFRRKREDLAAEIEPVLLSRYERMKERLGHAVSNVSSGVCEWCRVQLPAVDVQHARGAALVTCTNCARILYAE